MLTRFQAWEIAKDTVQEDFTVNINSSRELANGWYFDWEPLEKDKLWFGDSGVIINKESGKCFMVGSAHSIEYYFKIYEEGLTEDIYDLRVLTIHDQARTLDFLQELQIQLVEPEWKYGTEWLIPRLLTRNEINRLLRNLPSIFRNVGLYDLVEPVHKAKQDQFCNFELLPIEIEKQDPFGLTLLKRLCQNKPD